MGPASHRHRASSGSGVGSLLLLSACGGELVFPPEPGFNNDTPVVAMSVAPNEITIGEPFRVLVDAEDEDPAESLRYWILSNGVELCRGRGLPAECDSPPTTTSGAYLIDAVVIDSQGFIGEARQILGVDDLDAPTVVFRDLPLQVPAGTHELTLRVEDDEDPTTELTLWSSIDGLLIDAFEVGDGSYRFPLELTPGHHILSAVNLDSDGMAGAANALLDVIPGQAPAAPVLYLRDGPFYSHDPMVVSLQPRQQPDVDPLWVEWLWERGSVEVRSRVLEPPQTQPGQIWRMTATPKDPWRVGPPTRLEVEIVNAPPVVSQVEISVPTTGSHACRYTARDPDADPLDIDLTWYGDAGEVLGHDAVLRSTDAAFLRCTVIATDTGGAQHQSSALHQVGSTPLTVAAFLPATATVEDPVEAEVVSTSDPRLTFRWRLNHTDVEWPDHRIPASAIRAGDRVDLEVIAASGANESRATVGPLHVLNSPPVAPTARLVREEHIASHRTRCALSTPGYDPDGDPLAYQVQWFPDRSTTTTDLLADTLRYLPSSQGGIPGLRCTLEVSDGAATAWDHALPDIADCDEDQDGWNSHLCGGPDCHDGNALIHPGRDDTPGDGTDHDCDGLDCLTIRNLTACDQSLPRDEAAALCASAGKRLPEVHSSAQQKALVSMVASFEPDRAWWLGRTVQGWDSARPTLFTAWASDRVSDGVVVQGDGLWAPSTSERAGVLCMD